MSQPLKKKFWTLLVGSTRPVHRLCPKQKICRTLFVGRHKTGPCETSVTNGTWTPYIFSAALFYAHGAILCFSNFRHGQAWHHRCGSRAMGQTASLLAWLPHGFRPTAPLGAEACPWFSFYFFFLNIKQSWLMDTMTPRKISTAPLFVAQHRNTRNYKNLLICRTTNARLVFKTY